jgi:FSR family fosmidomycin resistance protein-like MFS transporter
MLQPVFGVLADRTDRRLVAAGGPLLCAAGMALLGLAPGFALAAALVTLRGGAGSSRRSSPPAAPPARRSAPSPRPGWGWRGCTGCCPWAPPPPC